MAAQRPRADAVEGRPGRWKWRRLDEARALVPLVRLQRRVLPPTISRAWSPTTGRQRIERCTRSRAKNEPDWWLASQAPRSRVSLQAEYCQRRALSRGRPRTHLPPSRGRRLPELLPCRERAPPVEGERPRAERQVRRDCSLLPSECKAVEQFAAQPPRAATARVERGESSADTRTSRGRWSPGSACSRELYRHPWEGE